MASWPPSGVTANACCPGGVATGIWRNFGVWKRMAFLTLLKGPKSGARLPGYLPTSPGVEGVTGKYFEVRSHLRGGGYEPGDTEVESSPASYDQEFQRKLWDETARLTRLA